MKSDPQNFIMICLWTLFLLILGWDYGERRYAQGNDRGIRYAICWGVSGATDRCERENPY